MLIIIVKYWYQRWILGSLCIPEFYIFCTFTTCIAFGMRNSDHLFVYWKRQLTFSMKQNEQPHRFLALPTIWVLLPLLLGVYSMCSVHVTCAAVETTGRKFATWHSRSLPTSDLEFNIIWEESVRCLPWYVCQNTLALLACLSFSLKKLSHYLELAGLGQHVYSSKVVNPRGSHS